MKKYIRATMRPEKIEAKKKFINQVIDRIRRGDATPQDIDKACDSVVWLWKWKHIDDTTKDELCTKLTNALDGVWDDDDWED